MGRVRRCDDRCHRARGTRCACWCHGAFHSAAGAINREAIDALRDPEKQRAFLEAHGFKQGKAKYIEQKELGLS